MSKVFAVSAGDGTNTWGSEGTVGASDGVPFTSLTYGVGVPTPQRQPEIGIDEEKEPNAGLIENNEMTSVHRGRFMDFDQLFALAMGADAVTSPAAGIYQHLHTYVAQPSRVAFAAADTEQDGLMSWPGVYVTGFEISGAMGEPVQFTFNYLVAQPVIDGAVNTQGVMNAVGFTTSGHLIDCTDDDTHFRINAQSGGSVSASDEACINSFTLSFQRSPRKIYCMGQGNDLQQPVDEGWPEASLNVTFSKRVDAALPDTYGLLALAQAGTPLKAELQLVGGTLNASYDASMRIRFPALTIQPDMDLGISNPNVNELSVPFLVTGAATAPTGFSGLTTYFDVMFQNILSTDYIS